MTPLPNSTLSDTAVTVCFFCVLLVPFAAAGLSLINTGLGRSRNAGYSMMSALCVLAVAAGAYFVCGFAWQGMAGHPGHVLSLAGKKWNWIGAEPFFFGGLEFGGPSAQLAAFAGMLSVGLAALIPLGSGAERWGLSAACASSAVLAGFTYPLFAHWVWGGGWLSRLGSDYGLGRGFLDAGGAATIQALGGLTALALAWILRPRYGKYSLEGAPNAVPSHNIVLVLFGCLLALVGWLGLNCAGAILFAAAEVGRTAAIGINTMLAASAGALAAAVVTRMRFGKPDASLSANGWVGGLAASSAACAFVSPATAVLTGLVSGVLVVFSVPWLERLVVDDPAGAISVHALGGLWGVLAAGVLGHGQLTAQFIGVATLLGLMLPLTYGLNWTLNRFYPQRVAIDGERQGLDRAELGADAYPEFVIHTEEFIR